MATAVRVTKTTAVHPLTKRKAWLALKEHQKTMRSAHLRELFKELF